MVGWIGANMKSGGELFYLASQSPRRLVLLGQLGLVPQLLLPTGDLEQLEEVFHGEEAQTYVERVAYLKWQAGWQRLIDQGLPLAPVLSADTTVVLHEQILGKPCDAEQARSMLLALSGQTHRVMTAVVVGQGIKTLRATSVTWVTFAQIPPEELERYIHSGEFEGKAGSYGIQGQAARWIKSIQGSYSGVMGLPLFETHQLLKSFGLAP